ncbi:MAG: hypothetical protein FD159_2508, partial [Syntrophaceae bacterium]
LLKNTSKADARIELIKPATILMM